MEEMHFWSNRNKEGNPDTHSQRNLKTKQDWAQIPKQKASKLKACSNKHSLYKLLSHLK